ncbi:MAG: formate dehydrogenase subunit gamma, partial [Actinomycetota bacterium]
MLREPEEAELVRYTFADRLLHWTVAITFIYLMVTGLALGYPRMAWIYDILGGGQTVRFLHPVAGVIFSIGIIAMLVAWFRDMLFDATDREWTRKLGTYAREGHTDVDVDRYNAGQKGYYWFAVITGILLLLTGLPLWFPTVLGAGLN